MGKIPQGILGGVSGKIGGVVGSSWKGINVIKTKPLSVANPKTAGQIAQRTKFSNTVAFAVLILSSIIKPLWDRFSGQMSGFNRFIQTNLDLFVGEFASPAADLVISVGRMAKTVIDSVSGTDGSNIVTVAWTDDSGSGFKLTDDDAYIVIVNETTKEVTVDAASYNRGAASSTIMTVGDQSTGDVLHAYLAFRRADGTVVSQTSYATATV